MRGKDAADSRTADVSQDHPRLCGEKRQSFRGSPEQLGSPPPMRGKAVRYGEFFFYSGITPAYAGKSGDQLLLGKSHCGSPPPMRGKGCYHGSFHLFAGITPAYAGKSTWKCMPFATLQDHPRLCGEKCKDGRVRGLLQGSPPPMRGKVFERYS